MHLKIRQPPGWENAWSANKSGWCSVNVRYYRWQLHSKGRPYSSFTFYKDFTAHHLAKMLGDGQPQPPTAETAAGGRFRLCESLKEVSHLFVSHADAGVGYGEIDPFPAFSGHPANF